MSFLGHVGHVVKKILGIATTVAKEAEPLVDAGLLATGLGGLIPLYNSAVGFSSGIEALTPTLAGSGPQKLAQLTGLLLPMAQKFAADNNLAWPEAEIQKWASAVVDTINLIPAPTAPPVAPAP